MAEETVKREPAAGEAQPESGGGPEKQVVSPAKSDYRPVRPGGVLRIRESIPGWMAWVLGIIPILVLYFFTQKQFTESIARSGLKG